MRVLHLLGWPVPESMGGTEVYVLSLAQYLQRENIHSVIAFPDDERPGEQGVCEGIPTSRFATSRASANNDTFRFILKETNPDLVHFHSITSGVGRQQFDIIRDVDIPVVITCHIPGLMCRRGTLLHHGKVVCDGVVDRLKCSVCYATGQGAPIRMAETIVRLPRVIRHAVKMVAPRRLQTFLQLPELTDQWWASQKYMLSNADRVVAVCGWLYDVLLKNGVPKERLVLSRQATNLPDAAPEPKRRIPSEPLRIGYLGRIDPVKGVAFLAKVLASLDPGALVTLDIHAVPNSEASCQREYAIVQRIADQDRRIRLHPPIPREELDDFFRRIDLLAVPSLWLETGPLVVYEALAHRIPVLGSDLGGISELVRHAVDGWLVPPGDETAWKELITSMARGAVEVVCPPWPSPRLRTWNQVAAEMKTVYSEVLSGSVVA